MVEEKKPFVRPQETNHPASAKIERAASMWDLLHPSEDFRGQKPNNPYKFRRPLPEIPRNEDYGQVWQTAPFANDFQSDYSLEQASMAKQISTN